MSASEFGGRVRRAVARRSNAMANIRVRAVLATRRNVFLSRIIT